MINQIRKIAVDLFLSVLKGSAKVDGTFSMMTTAQIGDAVKPLMLVGNAHSQIRDGQVIAVLNPDAVLLDQVVPGCGYHPRNLKEIVAGKCDAMVNVWVDAYKRDGVRTIASYRARTAQAAKFAVR